MEGKKYRTQQPKKIVGFQPARELSPPMFQMDEELKDKPEQGPKPKTSTPEIITPPTGNPIYHPPSSPQYHGRSMRRPSTNSIGSPSMGASYQERLFPRMVQEFQDSSKHDKPPKTKTPSFESKETPKLTVKQERKLLQEQQRAAKLAARVAAGLPVKGKSLPKPNSPPKQFNDITPIVNRAISNRKQLKKQGLEAQTQKAVTFFSHLAQFETDYNLLKEKNTNGKIHPAVISLGIQYSESTISGGNARCMAMLLALSKVIAIN